MRPWLVFLLIKFSSSLLGGSVKLMLLQLYEMWELDFLMLSEYHFSEALGLLLGTLRNDNGDGNQNARGFL